MKTDEVRATLSASKNDGFDLRSAVARDVPERA